MVSMQSAPVPARPAETEELMHSCHVSAIGRRQSYHLQPRPQLEVELVRSRYERRVRAELEREHRCGPSRSASDGSRGHAGAREAEGKPSGKLRARFGGRQPPTKHYAPLA